MTRITWSKKPYFGGRRQGDEFRMISVHDPCSTR